jgi:hypothetical protein
MMNLGVYGILVVFALFILLLIFNPNLSCFGKRVKSPLYPLFRGKKKRKEVKTEDYGFDLGARKLKETGEDKNSKKKTEDNEFYLVDNGSQQKLKEKKKKKEGARKEKDVHSEYSVDSD